MLLVCVLVCVSVYVMCVVVFLQPDPSVTHLSAADPLQQQPGHLRLPVELSLSHSQLMLRLRQEEGQRGGDRGAGPHTFTGSCREDTHFVHFLSQQLRQRRPETEKIRDRDNQRQR